MTSSFHVGDYVISSSMLHYASQSVFWLYGLDDLLQRRGFVQAIELEDARSRAIRVQPEYFDSHFRGAPDHLRVFGYGRQLCKDARDHIYGLIQILRSPEDHRIDYSLPIAQVFSRFT